MNHPKSDSEPEFYIYPKYRAPEMKRQTRFCRFFTGCLFAVSANVVTNKISEL